MSKNREKNKKSTKSLPSLREAWRLNRKALMFYYHTNPKLILSKILSTLWGALTPYVGIYLAAQVIEELAGGCDPVRLRELVLATLLSGALIALVSALLGRFAAIVDSSSWCSYDLSFSQKMMELDFPIADDPETRRKLSTIRQNQNGVGMGLFSALYDFERLMQSVFSLFGGLALTLSLFSSKVPESQKGLTFLNSPLFILLFLLILTASSFLSSLLATKADSYSALYADTHRLANRLFSYFGFLGGQVSLAADMRIYRQDLFCKKYNEDKTDTFNSKGIYARLAKGPVGFYASASTAVSILFLTGCIYVFVCLKAWAGAFGIGMVTQYISAISRFSGSIGSTFSTIGHMRNSSSFIKLCFDFLEIPNTMYQGSLTVEKRRDREYEVEFQDVSFRYPGSEQYALRHVNMKFKVGQRLAVVGQNGSGKTTFIKLLCRLYDPTEGVILLNGIDIRKYNYREYLSVFSVVFQDFSLTDHTLGQNLAASSTYTKTHAESCLVKAGFGERLATLPLGTDTYLGKIFSQEGVDMSGGERQKIALARTLYKDSPFIVLDEPTAALDPVAESEVYVNFNQIIEDKTAVYISHRLSSCRFCDEILVFDKGKIVQHGSHDTLVADRKGKYHELWYAQAQYYAKTPEAEAATI